MCDSDTHDGYCSLTVVVEPWKNELSLFPELVSESLAQCHRPGLHPGARQRIETWHPLSQWRRAGKFNRWPSKELRWLAAPCPEATMMRIAEKKEAEVTGIRGRAAGGRASAWP
jgi:hypothetical protein